MRLDERIERTVQVAGEVGGEAVVRIHHSPEPRTSRNRCMPLPYPRGSDSGPGPHATIRPMGRDDRYDDLIASLGGFHRSWLIYLGLELGLFAAVRAARGTGLTTADLAAATETHPEAVEAWAWASDAHEL